MLQHLADMLHPADMKLALGIGMGAVLATMLAACGDDNTASTTDTTGGSSSTSNNTTTTAAPTTDVPTTDVPTTDTTDGSATGTSTTDATTTSTTSTTDVTTTTSTTGPAPVCGDGNVDDGEECDDGNQDDTDTCTNACKTGVCGDGLVILGVEECDDANQDDADACTNACKNAICGDMIVGPGEMCDDGNMVDTDMCTAACAPASCGDTIVEEGVEECDDGNAENTDACLSTCLNAKCGDMAIQADVEDCDDGNMVDTDACLNTCKTAKCGDTVIQMGVEECDDGNMVDTDACINTCKTAKCGDGKVQANVEQCDDGNMVDNDACSNTCKLPVGNAKVYLTSSNGDAGFYGYTIANNSWATLANPPSVTRSQITNDGTSVYSLGSNNIIYKYNPANNTWSVDPTPGPNAQEASQPIGFFKWTSQGFYYLKDGSTNLRHYKNGAWALIALPSAASCAGSWDKAKNELYIRTYSQLGFRVINTTNDTIVRTITDATNVGENSRTGSLSGAFFYDRTFTGTLQKLDAVSGVKTDTAKQPGSDHMGSDTNVATGFIYLSGYGGQGTVFQNYNPANNTITTLANQPNVSNHSTITVVSGP